MNTSNNEPNPFDTMRSLIQSAQRAQSAVADNASAMARLLRGNLRRCSVYDLEVLKRELRDFNAHTKSWKP